MLALVKGNREPHEAKKKSFDLGGNRTHDLRIRSTVTLPTELQGRTEKVGDDFKMVNRGEEEVWVQMNVVPRSTGNTNSGTRELTLKCKLKCYFKPMNNPLGVSPSKGKHSFVPILPLRRDSPS